MEFLARVEGLRREVRRSQIERLGLPRNANGLFPTLRVPPGNSYRPKGPCARCTDLRARWEELDEEQAAIADELLGETDPDDIFCPHCREREFYRLCLRGLAVRRGWGVMDVPHLQDAPAPLAADSAGPAGPVDLARMELIDTGPPQLDAVRLLVAAPAAPPRPLATISTPEASRT